jgi:outer membrane receptor protein involved in Fe transport
VYIATGGANEDFYNFETDNLWNYEAGVKKSWSGGKYITDVTLFYLDWTDIQLEADFYDPLLGTINAIFNTAAAHSVGVEAAVTAQLARGLTLTTNVTYTEAELDEATPALVDTVSGELVVLQPGTPLPATPQWSTASSLQYFWDNSKLGFPFIALEHFYKDSIVVWLTHQNTVPSYNTFALKIGATFANGLNVALAVRNLTDTRAWTTQTPGVPYTFLPGMTPVTGWMTQPRSVSLTLQKNF